YLQGSRLWGTAIDSSDYDFVIVSSSPSAPPHSSLHNGPIDASVFSIAEFQKRLDEHSLYEVVCLFLPAPWIWKGPQQNHRWKFVLQKDRLKTSVFEETDRDWAMARVCV